MTRDLYFTILVDVFTNHVSAKNTYLTNHIEWTEHNIMEFKTANRYSPITLIHNFHHPPFLCQANVM